MFYNRLAKLLVSLTLLIILTLAGMMPVIGEIHPAEAAVLTTRRQSSSKPVRTKSSIDWYQVDQSLINAVRSAYDTTEKFAVSELDNWEKDLMQKVDGKFLNWYFSYFNQKAQEFGIPFAWLAFKMDDSLKLLRKEDEKDLATNEVLHKRMIEDLSGKFNELVLDSEAQGALDESIKRVKKNYALLIDLQFTQVKNTYHISDEDWAKYLNQLAAVTYDTGTDKGTFSPESFISNLTSKLLIVPTVVVGGKVVLGFVAKAAAKMAVKAGGVVLSKVIAQSIDPMLAVGILIWDAWDYNRTVKTSRPALRQNILDFLDEVKLSILDSPDKSIMAGIKNVEGEILTRLEARLAF